VIISYDDSGGWYDHVMPPIVNQANGPEDHGCGTAKAGAIQSRCGHGPRQPLLVISPYARTNFVDHTMTDQTSILKFIEDNWGLGSIGNQSFDVQANSLDNMLDFKDGNAGKLFLTPAPENRSKDNFPSLILCPSILRVPVWNGTPETQSAV